MQHLICFSARRIALMRSIAVLVGLGFLVSGCTLPAMLVGAVATTGIAAAQERSMGDAVDDLTTQVAIEAKYVREDTSLFANVDTTVIEGRVLLTGLVKTPEDRIEAARLAWQAPGVNEVINEIEVTDRSTLWAFPKDAWISTRLRAKLIGDGDVYDINYDIETVNGTVYLLGIARDEKEHNRVLQHARNIGGVKKVVTHVRQTAAPRNVPDNAPRAI